MGREPPFPAIGQCGKNFNDDTNEPDPVQQTSMMQHQKG